MYNADTIRTYQWKIKNQTPHCEIEHDKVHELFEKRWKSGDPINEGLADSMSKLSESMNNLMKEKQLNELNNPIKLKEELRTRGNLSAHGIDRIIHLLIKLERENPAKLFIELMKVVLNRRFCPQEWENAILILL
jgi:hypothetical protein